MVTPPGDRQHGSALETNERSLCLPLLRQARQQTETEGLKKKKVFFNGEDYKNCNSESGYKPKECVIFVNVVPFPTLTPDQSD